MTETKNCIRYKKQKIKADTIILILSLIGLVGLILNIKEPVKKQRIDFLNEHIDLSISGFKRNLWSTITTQESLEPIYRQWDDDLLFNEYKAQLIFYRKIRLALDSINYKTFETEIISIEKPIITDPVLNQLYRAKCNQINYISTTIKELNEIEAEYQNNILLKFFSYIISTLFLIIAFCIKARFLYLDWKNLPDC